MTTEMVILALLAALFVRLETIWYKLGKLEGKVSTLWALRKGTTDGRATDTDTGD